MKSRWITTATLVFATFSLIEPALAADEVASSQKSGGIHWLDWVMIALYAGGTIYLGVHFSRKQRSPDEYFTGGGNMNALLIGVSLFATLLSTISYLGMPGESAGKGPIHFVGMLAYPVVFLIFGFWMLPQYMKHRVTSAYELLELRLGHQFRVLGALMFLMLRLIWMSVLLKFAGDAMVTMLQVDPSWSLLIVAVIGAVAIIYTSLGGLQAVVITDSVQTVLLYGGALTILAMVTWDFGGVAWMPSEWPTEWKPQPVFPTSAATRVTWIGSILTTLVWNVATLGGDQTTVQRFMATKDSKSARTALLTQFIVSVVVGGTLCLVGIALLAHFNKERDSLPEQQKVQIAAYEQFNKSFQEQNERYPDDDELRAGLAWDASTLQQTRGNLIGADQWFPRYISHHLPIGLSGLVIAAMFAAAMSSLDSGVNSITAVVMSDFVQRRRTVDLSERQVLVLSRGLAIGIGAVVIFGSILTEYVEGNIMEVTQKSVNLLTTPIFGLFFYAIFAKKVHAVGVWAGTIVGTITATVTAFGGQICLALHVNYGFDPGTVGSVIETRTDALTGIPYEACTDPVSFQWIGPLALVANLLVGTVINRLMSSSQSEEQTAALD